MGNNKDFRQLIQRLEAAGCEELAPSAKGHPRVRLPNGRIVVGAGTPSDHRSIKNFLATCRRLDPTLEV